MTGPVERIDRTLIDYALKALRNPTTRPRVVAQLGEGTLRALRRDIDARLAEIGAARR